MEIKKYFLRIFLICTIAHVHSRTFAQDISHIRISLLTCTPGEELYSTFGHSALRVTDSSEISLTTGQPLITDMVYNYGTFDMDEKNFYLKFIGGRLKYFLSVEDFYDFKNDYIADHRGITEQVLDFSPEEKLNIRRALIENHTEENKYYVYDFFLDNCTTRLRDIIIKNHQPLPALPAVMPVDYTFRNAVHRYLPARMTWSRFGMDILLGANADDVMTTTQQEFLPDNLMHALDGAKHTRIVASSQNLYAYQPQKKDVVFFTPGFLFWGLFFLFLVLSLFRKPVIRQISSGLDGFLFFSAGLLGIVLVVVWLITDYKVLKNNYNLLWAWPLHIIFAFLINSDKKFVKRYAGFTCIFLFFLLCLWHFLHQQMPPELIPLVILIMWRSGRRAVKTAEKNTGGGSSKGSAA